MIVRIINPKLIIVGNGISKQVPVETIADDSQIIRIIEKCLLNKSIIADKIEIEKQKGG